MHTAFIKSISVIALLSLSISNVAAQEWIDIATLSDQQTYQIAPATMATVKFSGDLYILIDGRYLSSQGNAPKTEEVAIRESDCSKSSGKIIIKRKNAAEIEVPFFASESNLPYRITKVVCGTYGRIKKLLNE